MSLSRPNYHQAEEVLQNSHFFSCQNKRILLKSDNQEPILEFARLNHSGKIILLFANHDYDRNISFECEDIAIVQCASWTQFSLFFDKLQFPIDYLVLDRVDTWDLNKTKGDRGRIRTPLIATMLPNRLKGTCVVMTTMGDDVGLQQRVDETISV